jgi:subtilase family serine protease
VRRFSTDLAVMAGTLAAAALLGSAAPAAAQRAPRFERETVNGRDVVAREVLVKFRNAIAPSDLSTLAGESDAQRIGLIGRAGVVRLRSRSLPAAALLALLARRSDVQYAEPNFIVHVGQDANDPGFSDLWGLQMIQAPAAWDLSFGSTSNVVAVVDTGIDYTHEDLAANMWSAPTAFTVNIDGLPVTCAAGTHGFNAIARTCDPMDDQNHGTHVSGTIGAVGNNGVGVVGVNWTAQLMGIKFLDADGNGTVADAISAIEFAIAAKQAFASTGGANVRVLSASWGGPEFSQALLDEVNAANDADMLLVAGAGNDGTDNDVSPFYPAAFDAPNVIAVASTSFSDDLSWFSNYGATSVDVAAPGEFILSTIVGNTYEYESGTSMATPHVSGAAALVLSLCNLNTAALKDTLLGTVDPNPSLEGLTVTGGRLNVNSALHACTAPPETPSGLTAHGGDMKVTLSWPAALGAIQYNVRRSLTSGGPYSPLATAVKGATYTDTAVVNGTKYYYVISAVNTLGESGDSNEASATPDIPSDIVLSALTAPSVGGAGAPIAVSVIVKNQGTGVAHASTTRFYLSSNSTVDAQDLVLGEQPAPELATGASVTVSMTLTIPADIPVGRQYLIASGDADDVLGESNEANNRLSRSLQIGPDLAVSAVTAPAASSAGGTISITDTTTNQGGAPAASSRTEFYLSTNSTLGAGDVLLGGRNVTALAAGTSNSATTMLTIPLDTPVGTYFVVAKADSTDLVSETNEANNTKPDGIYIGSDLIISAFTLPATGGAGTPIVVTDTVKNQGGGAAPASVTRFYLSTNGSLDSSDTLLAAGRPVPSLDPGETSSGSTSVIVPAATPPGVYYIIAKADGDGTVVETSETNNTSARYIPIGSDLVVSAMTVPAKGGAGGTITVSATTTNQGGGSTAASMTRLYLSLNSAWDSGDTLLAGGEQVPELAAGASDTGSIVATIPAGTASGQYYIIGRADADSAVLETNEANNTLARTIQIGGDLVVSAFTVPAKGGAGLAATVTDTTTNQGAGSLGPTTTKFYLSTNSSFDAADVLVGSRAIGSLDPGASSSGSTTVSIPGGLASGSYYLIAVADADKAIAETVETNNTLARTILVGSELVVSAISTAVTKAAAGSSIVVSETVLNQGGGDAAASVVRFYLSDDGALDAGDSVLQGSRLVPALPPGVSSAGSTSVLIPAGTSPGTIYIIAKADADNVVSETQETNNTRSKSITIGPDLTLASVTLSSTSIPAGGIVNATDTVVNQGGDTAAPTTTRFYLSKNSTLDATDVALSPARTVPAIAPGGSNSGTSTLTIPLGTAAGSYSLISKADGDDVVGESSETNNVNVRSIQVTIAP